MDDVAVHLIESLEDANTFMRWLGERRPVLGVDTETGGLEWWKVRLRLIQFGDAKTAWVVPWDRWGGVASEALNSYIGQMVMHNAKFDVHMLTQHDAMKPRQWHEIDDTRLMAHVLRPTGLHGLKPLAKRLIDPHADAAQGQLDVAMERQGWTYDTIPADFPVYWAYAGLDAIYTAQLWEVFKPDLQNRGMLDVYYLDLCVTELLTRMESRGCLVDIDYAVEQRDIFMGWVHEATAWVQANFGVNPMSNKKLAEKLQEIGFVLTKCTDSGAWSVDAEVLKPLDHPLPQTALRIRQLSKISSTYLENFMELNENDVVHPSINPLGARTGRMSMSAPNLQNLPRDNADRPEALAVRNCFIPREGNVLIMADFDQIEQRIMAHYSYTIGRDPGMVQAFLSGGDFFSTMAQQLYVDPTITKKDPRRQLTKNASYAKGYGAGSEKFSGTAGVLPDVGRAVYDRIDSMYPGMKTFQREVERIALEHGANEGEPYITAASGRVHYADDGKLYTLVNYKIQGEACDVLKRRMIALDQAGLGDYMTIPVHDEVIMDAPYEYARDVVKICGQVMPDLESYTVPLTVGIDVVQRWGHKYTGQLMEV